MAERIITPNGGKDKKIVDMHNRPLNTAEPSAEQATEGKPDLSNKDKIVAALRDMAEKIESGQFTEPKFIVVMPMFETEIPTFVLGEQIPVVMLEGLLHKVATRMAFGQ